MILTERMRQLYDFIKSREDADGLPPSYNEMSEHMNYFNRSGIRSLLFAMEERGMIRRIHKRARTVETVKSDYERGRLDGYAQAMRELGKGT